MPAKAPVADTLAADQLLQLGAALRAQRKRLRIDASTLSEAAGLSRVTLHRIERGQASVTMGAYLNVSVALGLVLSLTPGGRGPPSVGGAVEPPSKRPRPAAGPIHEVVNEVQLADFPQLRRLAWSQGAATTVAAAEALSLYERHWRHVDQLALLPHERALIESLVTARGGSRLLV